MIVKVYNSFTSETELIHRFQGRHQAAALLVR